MDKIARKFGTPIGVFRAWVICSAVWLLGYGVTFMGYVGAYQDAADAVALGEQSLETMPWASDIVINRATLAPSYYEALANARSDFWKGLLLWLLVPVALLAAFHAARWIWQGFVADKSARPKM